VRPESPQRRRRHLLAGTGVDYGQRLKLADPRRVAIYFAKYGAASTSKEYQHQVPRDWFACELVCTEGGAGYDQDRANAPTAAAPPPTSSRPAARAGSGATAACTASWPSVRPPRTPDSGRPDSAPLILRQGPHQADHRAARRTGHGRVTYRHSTVRRRLFVHGRGFICVNDGAVFASQLAQRLTDLDSLALPRGAGSARLGAGRREGEPTPLPKWLRVQGRRPGRRRLVV